ncbi:hypothetical protein [Aquitalea magnusonii]|uniref:hypothetical protein n=1 Tax=Aquitalea magnusonii TaxID=332411 RepID=UPI000B5C57F4|nr:hypothetical protein [Aquitalea magnusonii]
MSNQQDAINLNVQERLRTLEVQQQVMTSLLISLLSTHSNPSAAKKVFQISSEHLVSNWLSSALQESWIEQGVAYRDMLLHYFPEPTE